ncbi:MAG: hypothetical protein ABFS16_15885 [Bacteroidota bacterium]
MKKELHLRYITHKEIDSEKWNRCIDDAPNCRIYAYDWHLDRTAGYWDALVWGDYDFVMPLPVKKKLGIKYIYQPLFSQQLGIFPTPPKEITQQFYLFLVDNFRYADFQLNSENFQLKENENITFIPRNNFLLPLRKEYAEISNSFNKNTKRNIAKSDNNQLSMVQGIRLEDYMHFKLENLQTNLEKDSLDKLKNIIAYGQYKGFGEIYGVYSPNNQLCAAVYFCRWKNRIIYFNAASNEQGKELRAMYFLVNKFIEENATKNLVLDFEGSMIPGVARFYSGFGASPETYFQLKINRLPLPLKWVKASRK